MYSKRWFIKYRTLLAGHGGLAIHVPADGLRRPPPCRRVSAPKLLTFLDSSWTDRAARDVVSFHSAPRRWREATSSSGTCHLPVRAPCLLIFHVVRNRSRWGGASLVPTRRRLVHVKPVAHSVTCTTTRTSAPPTRPFAWMKQSTCFPVVPGVSFSLIRITRTCFIILPVGELAG
jgi:hypothetical protein